MPKINPDILQWARNTAGLSIKEAAQELGFKDNKSGLAEEHLKSYETGQRLPSRSLLLRMSKKYKRPLLTFYLSKPPLKGDRGKDFRTTNSDISATEEAALDALLRDVQARHSLIKDGIQDEDDGDLQFLEFVGSKKISDSVTDVVNDICKIIDFDLDEYRKQSSIDEAFALLRSKTETVGIFVLLIGNLGSHHTKIDPSIFRGYAIADTLIPFVVINEYDSRAAWPFTLLHELAHIWLGETGISGAEQGRDIEKFCNEVAGQILLPFQDLNNLSVQINTPFEIARDRISEFAEKNNISSSMVAYRLHLRGNITLQNWRRLNSAFRKFWQDNNEKKKPSKGSGGPNYYIIRRHRIGSGLINMVSQLLSAGALSTSKAGKVLGVKGRNLQPLFETEWSR